MVKRKRRKVRVYSFWYGKHPLEFKTVRTALKNSRVKKWIAQNKKAGIKPPYYKVYKDEKEIYIKI